MAPTLDSKLFTPQPHYSKLNLGRRRRHSSVNIGKKAWPTSLHFDPRMLRRLSIPSGGNSATQDFQFPFQTEPQGAANHVGLLAHDGMLMSMGNGGLHYTSQPVRADSIHLKPMIRKDSVLGEVMLETEVLRGVVEAAGMCTDSEDIMEEEADDSGNINVPVPMHNHKDDYKVDQEDRSKANFSLGLAAGYSSTDTDSDSDVTIVKSTNKRNNPKRGRKIGGNKNTIESRVSSPEVNGVIGNHIM